MKRALLSSIVLAALCIFAALAVTLSPASSWTVDSGEEGASEPSMVIFSSTRANLGEVVYRSPSFRATITAREDGAGEHLRATTWRDPNPANDDDVIVERAFKVDADHASDLLEALLPLRTPRILDANKMSEAKLTELGLTTSERALIIGDKTYTLGREGFGHRRVFALEREHTSANTNASGGDRIVLLDASLVRALERADTYLPQRTLWQGRLDRVVRAKISDGQKSVEIEQLNRDDPELTYWSFVDRDGRSKKALAFMKTLELVRASDHLGDHTITKSANAVTLRFEDGSEDTIWLSRGADFASFEAKSAQVVLPEAKKKTKPKDTDVLVSSAWLRGTVVLNAVVGERLSERFEQVIDAHDNEVMLAPPERLEHTH